MTGAIPRDVWKVVVGHAAPSARGAMRLVSKMFAEIISRGTCAMREEDFCGSAVAARWAVDNGADARRVLVGACNRGSEETVRSMRSHWFAGMFEGLVLSGNWDIIVSIYESDAQMFDGEVVRGIRDLALGQDFAELLEWTLEVFEEPRFLVERAVSTGRPRCLRMLLDRSVDYEPNLMMFVGMSNSVEVAEIVADMVDDLLKYENFRRYHEVEIRSGIHGAMLFEKYRMCQWFAARYPEIYARVMDEQVMNDGDQSESESDSDPDED